ncbi:MAG TPA: 2,3-bisphosphoglycerate-independent phosphoglycerate mutase [Planctomycetaceae bacterium]|nr:2,3-bisphosphoglycerate-independent phosphoglycerate mutase [Planctomycetaceae bacterium]
MDIEQLTREVVPAPKPGEAPKLGPKIVLLVADGLGGLPVNPGGPTELEAARTPNLDRLARRGVSGSMIPIKPGITPGSGPGHLGLFGYDPLKYQIGRGVLEATGIGFQLERNDVATRCNFVTLDKQGLITNRRGGSGPDDRLSTEQMQARVERLRAITVPGMEVLVEPVREHRFVVVFRGEGLGGNVSDTDPQKTGVPPTEPKAEDQPSQRTAEAAREFIAQAAKILATENKANGLTMRGFSVLPKLPSYEELYGLRAAAIAVYPMYKGLAKLVGMTVVGRPSTLEEEIDVLQGVWDQYDFFFVHFKYTDSRGEDGDFEAKVQMIEQFDAVVPRVEALKPAVLVVTGDHSTPARLRSHSWHPVPTLLVADSCRPDACQSFGETAALTGGLGHFEAKYLMLLALAHAGRLGKFGA